MSYMLMQNEESIAFEWEKYRGYTVRPLPSTVNYYRKIISQQSSKQHSLVYGGTPEIRSIFQQLKKEVMLADRQPLMVRAMGLLTDAQQAIAENETVIKNDWLTLAETEARFPLLIGDDAINMVAWNQFELFLQNAHQILEENGLFVCHLLVKPEDNLIEKTIDDVALEFKQGKIKSYYDLASRLNFICYDMNSYAMGWQQTIAKIGAKKLATSLPEYNYFEIFKFCNSQFYCPPQAEFEALVEKYFTIEEIFYPHEHEYCLFEPIYLLRKKSDNRGVVV